MFSGFQHCSVVLDLKHGILHYFVACKHLVYFVFFCKVKSFSHFCLFLVFVAVAVLLADGFDFK